MEGLHIFGIGQLGLKWVRRHSAMWMALALMRAPAQARWQMLSSSAPHCPRRRTHCALLTRSTAQQLK